MARCTTVAVALLPAVLGTIPVKEPLRNAIKDVSQSFAWSGLGCYTDETTRLFQTVTKDDELSEEVCASICSDYPFYGMQYSTECWCGTYEADYDKYGASEGCTMSCPGSSSQLCGGPWAMNVFTQAEMDPSSVGCYADSSSDRVFEDKLVDSDGMTPEVCKAHCDDLGKPIYATQWGIECWCGEEGVDVEQNGSAVCDRPCSGDPTKMCGGTYAFTAYGTETETSGLVSDSIGCFADDGTDRVFDEQTTISSNTPESCLDYCADKGASYFGLQWGIECWCSYEVDLDYSRHGEALCDYPCPGEESASCGGFYAFDVFETGVTVNDDTVGDDGGDCTSCPGVPPTPTMAVPAPTPIMTTPDYDPDCSRATVRWAGTTVRAYFEGGGCATLTDLYESRSDNNGSKGPLYILDDDDNKVEGIATPTGRWLLESDLYVEDGSILYMHGTDIGGDCDELRIQSDDDVYYEIRGHGGSLSFKNTLVTSWDPAEKAPRYEYSGGRSYINCVSEKAATVECEGQAKNDMGECRMDIINSEMGYLGHFDSESYGLTWKVRGFCVDKSNPEVFDETNVYGDIIDSDIYGMYYGMYSYGHQGGIWINNEMHDNHQYGFDPHDDSDYLTIANNKVYNNVNHGIIASKRCNNVEIYDNEVYNGGAQAAGIFLHRSTDSASVHDNHVHDMYDAGLAVLESFNADIYDNVFEDVKYGIRISLGGGYNYVHDNVFKSCSDYGLYTYEGSDEPDVSDNGRPIKNLFFDNEILDTSVGVKIKEGDDTYVVGNTFTGTDELQFSDSHGTVWCGNSVPSSACSDTVSAGISATFATGLDCDRPDEC